MDLHHENFLFVNIFEPEMPDVKEALENVQRGFTFTVISMQGSPVTASKVVVRFEDNTGFICDRVKYGPVKTGPEQTVIDEMALRCYITPKLKTVLEAILNRSTTAGVDGGDSGTEALAKQGLDLLEKPDKSAYKVAEYHLGKSIMALLAVNPVPYTELIKLANLASDMKYRAKG